MKTYDPTAEQLIEEAVRVAYQTICLNDVSASTQFIQAGEHVFRLRLSVVTTEEHKAAMIAERERQERIRRP